MTGDFADILKEVIIYFPCFLLALTSHEFAHAFVAQRFGDETAAWAGRLTLNPLAHIDPLGTIVFPLLGMFTGFPIMGWAKPVPIDARNFKRYRAGLFWVSAAGPLSNFLFGFLTAFVYVAVFKYVPQDFESKKALLSLLEAFIVVNFTLGMFNLVPFPPLDGSQMLISVLPYNAQRQIYQFWDRAFYLLFLLMFMGFFRFVFIPVIPMTNISVYVAERVFSFL